MLIRILGRVGADLDGEISFDPPSGPQRRLLALLAMRVGRPVAADTICDLFELTPGAVRTSVSRLRKQLGSDVLVTTPGGYQLVAETDAERFQSTVAEARSLDAARATGRLVEALALFEGAALSEFAAEPWATSEVTRLNELRAAAVEDLATLRIDAAAFDEALDVLHAHIVEFPYRDRPRELMMMALARAGRQVEALRVFNDYRSTLIDEVGVEPGESIRELELAIAMGDLPKAPSPAQPAPPVQSTQRTPSVVEESPDSLSNLPTVPNEFVGRAESQAEVASAFRSAPLVTLIGPGGVGKTRLALRVASGQLGLHSDGVWVVELLDCTDASDIVRTIAGVLGFQVETADELATHLMGRSLLVVLDNCEHVLDAAAEVVEALLRQATRLHMLATSRSPLRVVGEQVVTIGPLGVSAAVELYEARAHAMGVEIEATDRDIVLDICDRLDGMPLALELAAASMRVLSPADLQAQLHRRFDVLKGGQRGRVAGRHASLLAAVESSYEALTPDAQVFFNRLAVFAGDVPLTACDEIADGLTTMSFDLASELVDMSMITAHRGRGGTRYRMLETLRHYGIDRLRDADELGKAEDLQIMWSTQYVDDEIQAAYGASEPVSIDGLVSAVPNLRLAASRLMERGEFDRAVEMIVQLDDLAYAANSLAALAEPLATRGEIADHPDRLRLQAMELVRRSTLGSANSRFELADALAREVTVDTPGTALIPILLISTALGCGVQPELIDAIEAKARTHPDVAERARLLVAAGFARYYGPELPDDFELVTESLAAAQVAGMNRLSIAAASMACIAGLRTDAPLRAAQIAKPVLAELDQLVHPSIMSSGLLTMYTEAAIQAELAPDEHLMAIRRAGSNLRGDFNRLGLALARVVQHHGHHELAVQATGACERANRSSFSTLQAETILRLARTKLDDRQIESQLAVGAISEQTDVYRELWSVLETMFATRPN